MVLEPGKPEQLLSAENTLAWLTGWLERLESLPMDLKDQPSLDSAALRLLDTACELEIDQGLSLQWFAVRLDSPDD